MSTINLFGVPLEQKTFTTVCHISVGINLALAANWILKKYFDIHVMDIFGGSDEGEI